MEDVTFRVEYGSSTDVLDAINSCNDALKKAGILVEFVVDDDEHDGFELVTLTSLKDS